MGWFLILGYPKISDREIRTERRGKITMAAFPAVLVVEDNPQSRKTRVDLLREYEFRVFDAANAASAMTHVHSIPSLDLIITDINLDPGSTTNKSGLDLARRIRGEHSTIPIVGYSAYFTEGDLPRADRKVFNDYLGKGSSKISELEARLEKWHRLALEHRQKRLEAAADDLERLRKKYGSPNPDFATLLLLKPQESAPSRSGVPSSEELLNEAGYQLQIIEPGTSRPALSETDAKIISPLIVWLKREDDVVVAEVYGYPLLYSFGESESEAVTQLLLLMDGFYKELVSEKPAPESLSTVTRRLANFLENVFG